jgi:DNA-binding transcriptional LysR family regulator
MDFDRLRAFVWTLEEGGISAAARRLCRTQPAVTRMLQTLEEQVGAELIDRRARPMRPTVAGLRVLDYARDILQAADRLSVRSGTARPILRLGVSRSLLWQLRDPRFADASSPLSETDFIVRSGWSPRLYRRFARGEFDGAVLLMPLGWTPDVPCSANLLRSEPLVIVAPRGLRAGPKGHVTLDQLREQKWVLNPDGCGFRHALTRRFAAIGHRLHVQYEMDAAPQEHITMVAAGLGCSIVPASALTQDSELADRIQQLSVEDFGHELGVWLLWSERCKRSVGTHEALAAIFAHQGHVAVLPHVASRAKRQNRRVTADRKVLEARRR